MRAFDDQAALFDRLFVRTNSHRFDPETSRLAASDVATSAWNHAERVFQYLDDRHPCAFGSHELAAALGDLTSVQVSKRLSDLKRAGRIVADGERYKNPSGSMADRYRSRRSLETRTEANPTPKETLEANVKRLEARVEDLERKLRVFREWNRELRDANERSSTAYQV